MTTTDIARQTFPAGTRFITGRGVVTLEAVSIVPAVAVYGNADGTKVSFTVKTPTGGRTSYRWTIDEAAAKTA